MMDTLITELCRLFPNWGMFWLSLGWVGAAFLASTLLNNQTMRNKWLNGFKAFGLIVLVESWAVIAAIYDGQSPSLRPILIGVIGWAFYEIGDWSSFAVYSLNLTPGGPGGWIWRKISLIALRVMRYAGQRAEETLRPTERKLIEHQLVARLDPSWQPSQPKPQPQPEPEPVPVPSLSPAVSAPKVTEVLS